jgi:hypothetical protein
MKYIIGDVFKSCCDNGMAICFSDYKILEKKDAAYIIGQGLTYNEFIQLLNDDNPFNFHINKVDLVSTHKHKDRNSLIVNFMKLERGQFSAGMYIHGDNDLLMDHVTGFHIPGIALIEAARELFIVSLSYLGLGEERFILKDISSEFFLYVFPVEVQLFMSLECLKDTKGEKIYQAYIKIFQSGRDCAVLQITASLVPENVAGFNELLSSKNVFLSEG